MSLTDRDRKILIALVPLLLLGALWFLVIAPKQSQASKVSDQLTKAESTRDAAQAKADTVKTAKADYAKDYETVVHLGKAIPSTVDTPSLIVQLSKAAKGTHISFRKIKAGARTPAATTTTAPTSPSTGSGSSGSSSANAGSSSGSSGAPVASGGQSAQSGPGKAAENANNAQQTANSTSANTQNANPGGSGSGSSSGTGQSSGSGATPASPGGATPQSPGTGASTGSASSAPGLDTVPLEFGFDGSFFDLADFFHRMKRFVRVANQNLRVGGRLMTIDNVSFDSSTTFPILTGEIKATVYLAPKNEGATAGATPSGPPSSTPAATPAGGATPTNASAPAPTPSGSGAAK